MKRYDCLEALLPLVDDDDLVVTNLGGVRVEWHALRPSCGNYNVFTLGLALRLDSAWHWHSPTGA